MLLKNRLSLNKVKLYQCNKKVLPKKSYHTNAVNYRKPGKKTLARMKRMYPEMFDNTSQQEQLEEQKKKEVDTFKRSANMTLKTLNDAQDKYVPQPLGSPIKMAFWSGIWTKMKKNFKNVVMYFRLIWMFRGFRKKDKGFKEKFRLKPANEAAREIYTRYATFAAVGNFASKDLDSVVSYKLGREIQRDLKERNLPKQYGVKFTIDHVKVSPYNIQAISAPDPIGQDYLQFSYYVRSIQDLKIYDKATGEVLNAEDEPKLVEEYFVLEKNMTLVKDHWIIVQKLKISD